MHRTKLRSLATVVAATLALVAASQLSPGAGSRDRGDGMKRARFRGTWYAALDAEPFGLPPGVALSALMTIHGDGTLQIFDAGDFGAPPISQVQSAQFGSWVRSGKRSIRATTLFFAGDPVTKDTTLVKRVRFRLWFERKDYDRLVGVAETVEQLQCPAAPLPGFLSCPNPITTPDSEWVPEPGGAPNVGFEAWRLEAR